MTIPTIHLNGTNKESLIDLLCNASNALNDAYAAIKATAPNGRDYYPQGHDALKAAIDEHTNRLRQIDSVKKEIDDLAMAVMEASST